MDEMGEHSLFIGWVADILPFAELKSVMRNFDIPEESTEALCRALLRAKRDPERITARTDGMDERYERRAVFSAALEKVRKISKFRIDTDGQRATAFDPMPPVPPGIAYQERPKPNAISKEMLESVLEVLIAQEEPLLVQHETKIADRKSLGNGVNLRRHVFWFGLMTFWHHELGRKIGTSTDPSTGEPGGPLITFIKIVSAHHLTVSERTPAAIRSFIRRYKKLAIEDPYFLVDRFMAG